MTNSETFDLDQTHAPRTGRSFVAVIVGVLVVVVLSLGTDVVLHATGIYPPWFQPMAGPLWVLALAYRIPYGIAGGYATAALAPRRPVRHAVLLGFIGLALSITGAAMHWNAGPEYGPKWYNLSLVVTALPLSWVGGLLGSKRAR